MSRGHCPNRAFEHRAAIKADPRSFRDRGDPRRSKQPARLCDLNSENVSCGVRGEVDVVTDVVEPSAAVIVKLPVGKAVVALAKLVEVHEAVVARFFTTTTWLPDALPVAADAVTTLEFEEVTLREARAPLIEPRANRSLSRLEV